MRDDECKISVITVCLDAEKLISETVISILNQKYDSFEYLIIDGLSTDNTVDVIKKIVDKKAEFDRVRIVSERDAGIYNAMNKGIESARGEWILFINAGDKLIDEYVLMNVEKYLTEDADFVYGSTYYVEDVKYIVHCSEISKIMEDMPFCHQSIFNRSAVLKNLKYNENYKICGDYELYLRAFLQGKRFVRCQNIISEYLDGGISQKNAKQMFRERADIKKKYYIIKNSKLQWKKDVMLWYIRKVIKNIVPRSIITIYKIKKYGNNGVSF